MAKKKNPKRVKVQRVGKRLALILPPGLNRIIKVKVGDKLYITVTDGVLQLSREAPVMAIPVMGANFTDKFQSQS